MMYPVEVVCVVVVLAVVGEVFGAEEQLARWLLNGRSFSAQEENLLSAIASRINEHYMRTSRSGKRGRELFGKRSLGKPTNENDALEAVHSVEDSTSISSSYATPSEQPQRFFEFVSNMVDDAHGARVNSEVNPVGMPAVEFLNLISMTREPELVFQSPAGLRMRHRRGKSRELLG